MNTVLITGANRGLGLSLRQSFEAAGWFVFATARTITSVAESATVTPLALDLTSSESIRELAAAVQSSGRTVNLLINNAGNNPKDSKDRDFFLSTFRIEHFSGENVSKSLQINALAPTELTSRLLPALAEDAVVLNVSSWLGSIGAKTSGGHYGYAGSKALLNMFTRAMALEFAEGSRAAVAFNPGWMKTDMGGEKAKFTPEEVSDSILRLYDAGEFHRNNGAFLNTDGSTHPW